jgi:hypothetical protein
MDVKGIERAGLDCGLFDKGEDVKCPVCLCKPLFLLLFADIGL